MRNEELGVKYNLKFLISHSSFFIFQSGSGRWQVVFTL